MVTQCEKMIEITFEIYSKENNILFEKYIECIVMDDKEIFDKLLKQAKEKDNYII